MDPLFRHQFRMRKPIHGERLACPVKERQLGLVTDSVRKKGLGSVLTMALTVFTAATLWLGAPPTAEASVTHLLAIDGADVSGFGQVTFVDPDPDWGTFFRRIKHTL